MMEEWLYVSFKKFFSSVGVKSSAFMSVLYAVAMLGIFLIGYTAIPGQMDELKIAFVNDDNGKASKQIEAYPL